MAVAVLLQMGMVSVTYAACSSQGTERIAFGEIKSCCAHVAPDFAALSQKCCDVEKSQAVFFSYKDGDDDPRMFTDGVSPTAFHTTADAFVPVALRHVQVHLKIPPAAGRDVLVLHARLNV